MENRNAVAAIVVVQFVCAINWYTFSSVFSLIASDLHQDVSGLGLVTSTFVLGVAVFQLPAGLAAAKYGPKKSLLFGTLLTSASSVLIGLAGQILLLTALRFAEGIGEAFIFGPGVILIMRYFKKGSEGLGIGLFSGAFDLGGFAGISGWAILGAVVGWRLSIVAGGIMGLGASLLLFLLVPADPVVGPFSLRRSELRAIVLNKWLLIISAGLVTEGVCFGINSYFMVYYLEENLGVLSGIAGAVGGLTLVASVITSPLAGRAFDHNPSPKITFIGLCMASAVALALAAVPSVYAAVVSGLIVGATTAAGYVFGVGIARTIGGARQEYEALQLSWINGIGLFGGVWMPLIFSAAAAGDGYSLAWVICGVILVAVTIPLFRLPGEAGT